jgi:Flp pilus assembly protein TadG
MQVRAAISKIADLMRHGRGRPGRRRGGARGLLRHRSGVAALEFAMIAPVFLLMLLAMIAMGFFIMLQHEVQELASSAARSSVAGLNQAERNTLAQAFVTNYLAQSALLVAADVNVQTATTGTPPVDYQVSVSYSLANTPLPFLSSVIGMNFNTINSTAIVEFGGY